ncbi:N-acetyl sugar amidotransferase [Aliarcobacter cryaerophilus]|uniref:N-acetyl sugar amidotransferase n=1 Tax=Aliarcobacter cryaerophilus TaxID=28198 RepID=UPI003DA214D3
MKYQQCSRCIMDNQSDETINFDNNGYCNYCNEAIDSIKNEYFPNKEGEKKLINLLDRLKLENKNKKYDCIMGISGGLDSSYLAYLGSVKWGLRILAVHIDDGFNTEISERNIERISNFPNFDLKIIKPNKDQFNELTKAFMRAGVPNLAMPQDNVLFAYLYKFLKENKLKTFLSGGNFALESILQRGNTHDTFDLRNLKFIHKRFGNGPLNKLPFLSVLQRDIDTYIFKLESIRPLNFIEYNKYGAMKELVDYCGFEYYGSKHLENYLTKFVQQYWLYKKFNVDKRTSHLSSLIVSGQISREEALNEYKLPLYDEQEMEQTVNLILKKLEMNKEELNRIMIEKSHQHTDYPISIYLQIKPYLAKIAKLMLKR